MRAICGAIIAAGALIGLGLTALGVGLRYEHLSQPNATGGVLLREYKGNDNFQAPGIPTEAAGPAYIKFFEMDRGLTVISVVLILTLLAGLATAFIGLAFHHHRRVQELEHLHRQISGTHPGTHVPGGV